MHQKQGGKLLDKLLLPTLYHDMEAYCRQSCLSAWFTCSKMIQQVGLVGPLPLLCCVVRWLARNELKSLREGSNMYWNRIPLMPEGHYYYRCYECRIGEGLKERPRWVLAMVDTGGALSHLAINLAPSVCFVPET